MRRSLGIVLLLAAAFGAAAFSTGPASALGAGYYAKAEFNYYGCPVVVNVYPDPVEARVSFALADFCSGSAVAEGFEISRTLDDAYLPPTTVKCFDPDGVLFFAPDVEVSWEENGSLAPATSPLGLSRRAIATEYLFIGAAYPTTSASLSFGVDVP